MRLIWYSDTVWIPLFIVHATIKIDSFRAIVARADHILVSIGGGRKAAARERKTFFVLLCLVGGDWGPARQSRHAKLCMTLKLLTVFPLVKASRSKHKMILRFMASTSTPLSISVRPRFMFSKHPSHYTTFVRLLAIVFNVFLCLIYLDENWWFWVTSSGADFHRIAGFKHARVETKVFK